MGQAIMDCVKFLADTRDAAYRPNCDQNTAGQLADEEKMKEREFETARKAASDPVNQTIKKRSNEINSSHDQELGKGQERLKKARTKREKAKSQGVKEWIAKETSELWEHNRDLKVQMRTLLQKNRVPAWYGTTFYYTPYCPRGFREVMISLPTLAIYFLGTLCGIYFLIPQKVIWYLTAVCFVDVLLSGGLYVTIGNKTRFCHQDTLKWRWDIRSHLRANQKKIRAITGTIQKDDDEDLYDLEKYDDEIACVGQESSEIASRKEDVLGTFKNVTKTIILDGIIVSHEDKPDRLRQELDEVSANLRSLESSIREQNIRIVDIYGSYLGRRFLQPEKLAQLFRIMQAGSVPSIMEAIKIYQDAEQDAGRP